MTREEPARAPDSRNGRVCSSFDLEQVRQQVDALEVYR